MKPKQFDCVQRIHLVTTLRGQRYTQIFMYLIYKDFNKSAHLRSFVINQSVIEAPQDLCIRLTAERGNEVKSCQIFPAYTSHTPIQLNPFSNILLNPESIISS